MLESLSQAFYLLRDAIEALEQELNLIKWDCEDYISHAPIVDILNILRDL